MFRGPKTGKTEKRKTRPERRCLGCGQVRPQKELLRVASVGGDTPIVDAAQRAPGRGAYVCYNDMCLQRARQRRAFERALKLREGAPHHVWDEMARSIKANVGRSKSDVR